MAAVQGLAKLLQDAGLVIRILDLHLLLDDVAECSECAALSERKASSVKPDGWMLGFQQCGLQLSDKASLTDAWLSKKGDHADRPRGRDVLKRGLQQPQLRGSSDHWAARRLTPSRRSLGKPGGRPPHRDPLGLPLGEHGLLGEVVEQMTGRSIRGLADEDRVVGGGRLDASRGVHDIAPHECGVGSGVQVNQDFAGVDPDANVKTILAHRPRLPQGSQNSQPRPNGSLGVVLVD